NGGRQMFFLGEVKAWTLISDVRPFKAVYQPGDELDITHTVLNIQDTPIQSGKLRLSKTAPLLTAVSADEGTNTRPIPMGGREKIGGEHVFKISGKPERSQTAELIYECTLKYASDQPERKVALAVPLNLSDEDAEKVYFLKG